MKKRYFTFFTLLITAQFLAQTTSIPDANFEQYLIQANIDSDGVINGEVLTSDISEIEVLDVRSKKLVRFNRYSGFYIS